MVFFERPSKFCEQICLKHTALGEPDQNPCNLKWGPDTNL
jgi:hypothetical protein